MSSIEMILTGLGIAVLAWLPWYMFWRKPRPIRPMSPEEKKTLREEVSFYRKLTITEKKRFEQEIIQFLEQVTITGIETEVTLADRLLVAASAVIPLFGFEGWTYPNLNEVLLYPDTFDDSYQVTTAKRNIIGMVGSGAMNRMMILSQPALRESFAHPERKQHVGIHEFVHLMDKADGAIDGLPESLMPQAYVIPWLQLMQHKIQEIKSGRSDISPYAATNEAEFLSVAAEYFFTRPQKFQKEHPDLFALLSEIFQQRPSKNNN